MLHQPPVRASARRYRRTGCRAPTRGTARATGPTGENRPCTTACWVARRPHTPTTPDYGSRRAPARSSRPCRGRKRVSVRARVRQTSGPERGRRDETSRNAPGRLQLGHLAVDLLCRQDAFLDQQLLGAADPALVVAQRQVVLG